MTEIYLVDDHASMRDGLRAVLESAGHRVVGEGMEPTQALADLQRLQPAVLVLDLQLGNRSGLELLAMLHERALPVRTVVLTMHAQPGLVAQALRLGAAAYVLKGSPAAATSAPGWPNSPPVRSPKPTAPTAWRDCRRASGR